ncbi:MAG: ribonuclease J [Chloroflexi bacterium]|nr:ribonuclease J [Chloroflexota bacterium]MYF81389.1 ribonuclease J [Chloroflexota bacterium]MYI05102.1 ribonuclease J [Chloroflexota bacterium]
MAGLSDVAEGALRVVPLGGLGEIGRNMMVYETAEDMVVVDAGLLFPTDDMHGVDYIIPDASYVLERRDKLRGYLITHGHEDHIGALRFLLPQLQAPIYGSPLALGLIGWRLEESGILDAHMIEAGTGSSFDFGTITAEFYPVAHSIPDAFGIALRTPAGLVVHTGDFKIDHTPVMSEPTDLQQLAAYGQEGVRLLCSDSTYADQPGVTPSETVVGEALEQLLLTAPGRVIIATFASQIARIQQIVDAAEESGRVVFATGRSMEKNIEMSLELGYVAADERRLRPITDLGSAHDENTVIICTGAQGEPMSALSRMATGSHREVTLKPGDTVVLSSSPIPGNEAAVNHTMNNLYRRGVEVVSVASGHEHVHVRGHAAQEELKTVISLTAPQSFVPIHGEFRHLVLHARLARSMGVPEDGLHILLDGDVLELTADGSEVVDQIPAEYVYVDGENVGGVDRAIIRDRQKLADDGFILIAVAVNGETGAMTGDVEVTSRGFAEMHATEHLRAGAAQVARDVLRSKPSATKSTTWEKRKRQVQQEVSAYLRRETRQRPMVVVVAVQV